MISALTGGHPLSTNINKELAISAENKQIAMGVGSQRAAVVNKNLRESYDVVRENAPSTTIIGNIGAPQIEYAKDATSLIEADALAVHLNPLQEIIQPEGDVNAKGYIKDLEMICDEIDIPVVAKETGAGISKEDARILEKIGINTIDIQGSGGTSWAAVETYRAENTELGNLFWNWGIPTAISTIETLDNVSLPVISSGGIRNGLEAAKAIALGASCVGIGLPFLKHSYHGHEYTEKQIEKFTTELKTAMFLVGASNIKELQEKNIVISGKTREYLNEIGINTKKYARRNE